MSRRNRYVVGGAPPKAYDRVSDDVVAYRPERAEPEPGAAIRYHSQAEYRAAVKAERDRRAAARLPDFAPRKPRKDGKRRKSRRAAAVHAAQVARELAALSGPERLLAGGLSPEQSAALDSE